MEGRYLHLAVSEGDLYNEQLLKPISRTQSALSPTPRSRDHTHSSVRFSETAESYSYSSTFDDYNTAKIETDLDKTADEKLTYTDTFLSNTPRSGDKLSSPQGSYSQRSFEEPSLATSYSDTFEATTTASRVQSTSDKESSANSLYSSDFESGSQNTVIKSAVDSHRRLQTEDTLTGKYDYTESFETSDLSPSEDESESYQRYMQSEDDARYDFIVGLVGRLKMAKQKQTAAANNNLSVKPTTSREIENPPVEPEETVSYCKKKIKLLKKKKKYGLDCRRPAENSSQEKSIPVTEYGFHPSIIEKLKTKSFMAAMEKAANTEIHDPRECQDCRKVLEEVDKIEEEKLFMRGIVSGLQRKTMEDKISHHLATMDSISLIGNIMRDLPKPNDSIAYINRLLCQPLTDYHNTKLRQNEDHGVIYLNVDNT